MEELSEIAGLPRGNAIAAPGEARRIAVTAPDGLPISAQSWGDPARPAIVLIHGFGQCHLSWLSQVRSGLARDFHLLTYDLRGHGESGKPEDPARYAPARAWADDLLAVLDAAGVDRAVLVAWSFGGRVALDFIAVHGQARVAGLNMVGVNVFDTPGLRGTGSARLRPLMQSGDLSLNIPATREFLRRCFSVQPDEATFGEMLAYNMVVPPAVRGMVYNRPGQPESLMRGLRIPVLVTFGEEDALASLAGSRRLAEIVPGAALSLYPRIGHAPFFEATERFNAELREFALRAFG